MEKQASPFDVVAIAASAGGLQALSAVLGKLPVDFPVPILVVMHIAPDRKSVLPSILARSTTLRVVPARHGERAEAGTVYVAPPDHHLEIDEHGRLALTDTPKIHWLRPSANPLFESVGASFGTRALVVVVTGSGRDGVEGVILVKSLGGTVIAQDEATSAAFGMPGAAIATGCVDRIVPLPDIASTILALVLPEAR